MDPLLVDEDGALLVPDIRVVIPAVPERADNLDEFLGATLSIGAGCIGGLALSYGYNRFDTNNMVATVVLLVIFVQVTQLGGDRLSLTTRR